MVIEERRGLDLSELFLAAMLQCWLPIKIYKIMWFSELTASFTGGLEHPQIRYSFIITIYRVRLRILSVVRKLIGWLGEWLTNENKKNIKLLYTSPKDDGCWLRCTDQPLGIVASSINRPQSHRLTSSSSNATCLIKSSRFDGSSEGIWQVYV